MPRVQIRCHSCGTRLEVNLGEVERENLRGQAFLIRYCKECHGNTQWELYETAGPAVVPGAERAGQLRRRILLIDDDENILAVLEKALSREQFEVKTATSGRDAITLLARGDYDVILSDIRMPDFDGRQLFHFLDQNMPEYKERVIFLTGDMGNPETIQFLEETKCHCLGKPIDLRLLIELLHRLLPPS